MSRSYTRRAFLKGLENEMKKLNRREFLKIGFDWVCFVRA